MLNSQFALTLQSRALVKPNPQHFWWAGDQRCLYSTTSALLSGQEAESQQDFFSSSFLIPQTSWKATNPRWLCNTAHTGTETDRTFRSPESHPGSGVSPLVWHTNCQVFTTRGFEHRERSETADGIHSERNKKSAQILTKILNGVLLLQPKQSSHARFRCQC